MSLAYQEIAPSPALEKYVRFFWRLENSGAETAEYRFFADGSPGLCFNQTADRSVYFNREKLTPAVFLYGQATRHGALDIASGAQITGACFHPNALKTIFALDADKLTDDCLDLNELRAARRFALDEKLFSERAGAKGVNILNDFLTRQIARQSPAADAATDYAVRRLIESGGSIPLRDLQRSLRISERTLERKFKQSVGIAPKLFARICRFQNSLEQLKNAPQTPHAELAYDNLYADQSHLIRTFREFAGCTPREVAAGDG